MKFIEITTLPEIVFSHIYKANSYKNHFLKKENFLEISYIEEGEITYTTNDKTYHFKKGDIICPFFTSESQIRADNYHCHHTVSATFKWEVTNDEHGLLIPTYIPAESNTQEICKLINEFIYNSKLYKEYKTKGAAKFLELLCAIDNLARKIKNANTPSDILYVEKAKTFIEQNIHSTITQKQIAKSLGISCEYLCTIFKRAENTTIMRYVNKTKLKGVKELIDKTNLHLYEASAIFGYNDPNYVSKLYKQLFGYNITDKPNIHPEK